MATIPILTDIYEMLFGRPQRSRVMPIPRTAEQVARDQMAMQLARMGQAQYQALQQRGPQRLTPREISELVDRTYGQIGAGAVGSGVAKRLASESVERRGRELELGYEDELTRAAGRATNPLGAVGAQGGSVVTRPEDLGMLRAMGAGFAGRLGESGANWATESIFGPSEEERARKRRDAMTQELMQAFLRR